MIDSGVGLRIDFVTDDGIGKVLSGNDDNISDLKYRDAELNKCDTDHKTKTKRTRYVVPSMSTAAYRSAITDILSSLV